MQAIDAELFSQISTSSDYKILRAYETNSAVN